MRVWRGALIIIIFGIIIVVGCYLSDNNEKAENGVSEETNKLNGGNNQTCTVNYILHSEYELPYKIQEIGFECDEAHIIEVRSNEYM